MPSDPTHMVFTDFDGTLFRSDHTLSDDDLNSLKQLRPKGIIRVVATGRSDFSFMRAVPENLPIDYLIFSTGAGVMHWETKTIIYQKHLEPEDVNTASAVFEQMDLDYMIHRPIPDNAFFYFPEKNKYCTDFKRRLKLYPDRQLPMSQRPASEKAIQLLGVAPPPVTHEFVSHLRHKLPGMNLIRSTSPIDGQSAWLEVFPMDVSKSKSAIWLAKTLHIAPENTLAVGNDYNDVDLLNWAGKSYLVDNAPDDLKGLFKSVSSNDRGGVKESVELWLSGLNMI